MIVLYLIITGQIILNLYLFYRLFQSLTADDAEELIEILAQDLEEVKHEQELFKTEIYESIDATLRPLNKRLAMRLQREKEKDLNEETQIKGMISPSNYTKVFGRGRNGFT